MLVFSLFPTPTPTSTLISGLVIPLTSAILGPLLGLQPAKNIRFLLGPPSPILLIILVLGLPELVHKDPEPHRKLDHIHPALAPKPQRAPRNLYRGLVAAEPDRNIKQVPLVLVDDLGDVDTVGETVLQSEALGDALGELLDCLLFGQVHAQQHKVVLEFGQQWVLVCELDGVLG